MQFVYEHVFMVQYYYTVKKNQTDTHLFIAYHLVGNITDRIVFHVLTIHKKWTAKMTVSS